MDALVEPPTRFSTLTRTITVLTLQVSVPIVSNDRCKSMFLRAGRHEFIPDIFLCAGYETGGQDSCQVCNVIESATSSLSLYFSMKCMTRFR